MLIVWRVSSLSKTKPNTFQISNQSSIWHQWVCLPAAPRGPPSSFFVESCLGLSDLADGSQCPSGKSLSQVGDGAGCCVPCLIYCTRLVFTWSLDLGCVLSGLRDVDWAGLRGAWRLVGTEKWVTFIKRGGRCVQLPTHTYTQSTCRETLRRSVIYFIQSYLFREPSVLWQIDSFDI